MSAYVDYVRDFPARCRELLESFGEDARIRDREVTLLLSVATTGLVVPFERLRLKYIDKKLVTHPLTDTGGEKEAIDQLETLMSSNFLDSCLVAGTERGWLSFSRYVDPEDVPERWEEMRLPRKKMSTEKKTRTVVNLIRNALAHGNIFTTGHQIRELVFLSSVYESPGEFNVLVVSPTHFHRFLLNWFDFLDGLGMPRGIQSESLSIR